MPLLLRGRTAENRPAGFGNEAERRLSASPFSRRAGSGADVDPGRLDLAVFVQGVQRLVPAEAGLLEAAERRGDVAVVEAVDPDHAGAQRRRGLEGLGDVARPYRG